MHSPTGLGKIKIMPEFTTFQWTALCFCALMTGISKTALPGIGILVVPVMANAFSDNVLLSTGLVLPMLAAADIFAVAYYHHHAQWKYILRVMPWAIAGIILASVLIKCGAINNGIMKPLIGIIVLAILAVRWLWQRKEQHNLPNSKIFAAVMGLMAGITTQTANAAGPIMVIYLLAMGLEKQGFIGTSAWYFLILNWFKIPFFFWEGRITASSVLPDLLVLPSIGLGAWLGIILLKNIPQRWFNIILQLLAAAAAVKLLVS